MANSEISNNQREFRCTKCDGKILVPRDLPPTTGPCPHCGEMITSPAPEQPTLPPVPTPPPAPPAPPATPATPAPPATPPATPPTHQKAAPTPSEPALPSPKPSSPQPSEKPQAAKKTTNKKSKLIPVMLVVLLLIAATGAAVIFFGKEIGLNIPLSNVAPPAPKISAPHKPATQPDWQKEAYQVLHNYLAAATSQEKLPFILNAESLASRLQEFYRSDALKDRDTPAEAFSVSPLTEEDYKRGIYMLVFNQSQQEPVRVFAFFKRTPEGLKLDWETFAQTKYRTFHTFIESPKEGATGVFRVLMVDDTLDTDQAASEIRTYRIVDPAHTGDTTKIDVPLDSEIGRTLSAVNWRGSKEGRPAPRTATIELRWSGDSQAPKLEISRFICWEFLGLGGQESSSVTQ